MKLLTTTAVSLLFVSALNGSEIVVTFDDLPFGDSDFVTGDGTASPLVYEGISFARPSSDGFAFGWYYSRTTDLESPGFLNQYSAYALPDGGGVDESSGYGVANNFGSADVTFPAASTVDGMYVTNTTYAYLAIQEGDDGPDAGFVREFTDDDWFLLQITGHDADDNVLGTVDFYLADYRNGEAQVVSDWTWVDLTSLGDDVTRLSFALSSTDNNDFGMLTPAYFAIDNLTVTVPEPSSFASVLLASLGLLVASRRGWRCGLRMS